MSLQLWGIVFVVFGLVLWFVLALCTAAARADRAIYRAMDELARRVDDLREEAPSGPKNGYEN